MGCAEEDCIGKEWNEKKKTQKKLAHHRRSVLDRIDAPLPVVDCLCCLVRLSGMKNELIRKFETDVIHFNDEMIDRYQRMLADIEWFDTVKYYFKKFAEETGVTKWTTDGWTMTYITPKSGTGIDTERMKTETIMVINATTGEIEQVNAYDYFKSKTINRSPYVKVAEKE